MNKIYSFSKLSNLVPIYYYYNMPNLTHIIIVFFREHTYISILKNGVRGRKKASPSNIGFSKTEIWTDTAATTNFKTKLWIFSAIQSIMKNWNDSPMFSSRRSLKFRLLLKCYYVLCDIWDLSKKYYTSILFCSKHQETQCDSMRFQKKVNKTVSCLFTIAYF